MEKYFNCHSHTMYSNLRLLDCINRPKDLIDKAIELGLSGIAITDHECLSAHMEVNQYMNEIHEKYPNFKIALGNEIYLTDTRDSGQKYFHFILIAKDKKGYKALKKLSSIAWYNSYVDRGMERVPLLKTELAKVMQEYKGHVIATTACIGGELSQLLLRLNDVSNAKDEESVIECREKICNFVKFCQETFGKDDFYIECAPSTTTEQIIANQGLLAMASKFRAKLVVGTDAHYLTKKDRAVHKAYLTSTGGGDREVDSFYEFTYLMDSKECRELLSKSFDDNVITWIFNNSLEIQNKIENYSLERKQIIPKVEVPNYEKAFIPFDWYEKYPIICSLLNSDNIQERYWINECIKGLKEKNLYDKIGYLERIEIEADVVKCIGDKLDDCLFAYFNTFKHYINLFWECGSIVGPGRGSATGFLSNYLLGITQLDPIRWNLPYWRLTC